MPKGIQNGATMKQQTNNILKLFWFSGVAQIIVLL
jgi:hypothetical protein